MTMNTDQRRKRGCTDKVRYRNKTQAGHYSTVYRQRPYKCEFCDGFHLTSRW